MKSPAKILLVVLLLGLGYFLLLPSYHGPGPQRAEKTQAISNGRQLHLALVSFEAEYGSFPSAKTLARIVEENGSPPFPLVSSNDYLRQFVASGMLKSEKIGYCHYPAVCTKAPDEVLFPLDQAFAPGECGFSYVAGLSSKSPPDTPVFVAPMIPGTTRFDTKPFDGKAIVVRIDGSAILQTIREDGRVAIKGGKTLFDADAPYWRGVEPYIYHPAR